MPTSVIIAGYRERTLKTFADQLQSLFGGGLDVELAPRGLPFPTRPGNNSIILVQSVEIFNEALPDIARLDNIIFIRVALQAAVIWRLENIPTGERLVVAADGVELASELSKIIIQSIGKPLDITPAGLSETKLFEGKIVIVSGVPPSEIQGAKQVIDLGEPMLDMDTILDAGIKLDKEGDLLDKNISKDFIAFRPTNEGLVRTLERSNTLNSSVNILLEVIDGVVLSVEQNGNVRALNDRAEVFFGIKAKRVIGKNSAKLFPAVSLREQKVILPPDFILMNWNATGNCLQSILFFLSI
jgi:PAS domain-containing protein